MISLVCQRSVTIHEGDLHPNDVFRVGWRHERVNGTLQPIAPIGWMNVETRAIEMRRKGIATDAAPLDTGPPPPVVTEVTLPPQPIALDVTGHPGPPPLTEPVIKRRKK